MERLQEVGMAGDDHRRTVASRQLPQPGVWEFSAGNSAVWCSAQHLRIARVRGFFRSFSGRISIGETFDESAVSVTIDAASIDTGSAFRDLALRSAEFIDSGMFPTISYRSTGLVANGSDWTVDGELSANGVTRQVPLAMTFHGVAVDHLDHVKAIFSARGQLTRREWNMTYAKVMPGGMPVVGPVIDLEIWIDATRPE